MIVPSDRLLFFAAATLVPGALLWAITPAAAVPALGALGLLLLVVVGDCALAPRTARSLSVMLPAVVRLTKERPGALPVTMWSSGERRLRVGLPLPSAIECGMPEVLTQLPGEGAAAIPFTVTPRKAGKFVLSAVHVETRSPLGLWLFRSRVPATAELRVYPNLLTERKAVAALFLNRGRLGLHARRQVGKGRDFEKLREYVHGDPAEDVHWKATARRARLVTKEYRVERTQEVYLVLDASRLSGRAAGPGTTVLERFEKAALLLGVAADQQGDQFGLVTFSDRVDRFVRARSGRDHFRACRDALYTLEPRPVSPAFDELFPFLGTRLTKRALVVFLTELDDAAIAEGFLRGVPLLSRRHLVLVASLQPPRARPLFTNPGVASAADVYAELAGHLSWKTLRQLARSLRRFGATLALLPHETAAAGLIAEYLSVKGRQAL